MNVNVHTNCIAPCLKTVFDCIVWMGLATSFQAFAPVQTHDVHAMPNEFTVGTARMIIGQDQKCLFCSELVTGCWRVYLGVHRL